MNAECTEVLFGESEGIRTACRMVGKGPLLVLIHGAEADHTMFLGLINELSRDFTVVAYDQRDSGQTQNGSEPYGLGALADDAARLIAQLTASRDGERVHVYGTSFGGQIAQVLAARHADAVDRLVLGSTWRVGRPPAEFNPAVFGELARLRGDQKANAASIAAFFFTPGYLLEHPEAIDIFRGSRRTHDQQRRRSQMMQAPAPLVDFSKITAPVLLLAGGGDQLIPVDVTFELAQHLPNTECSELSELPHIVAMEAPRRVAAAIQLFLERS